MEPGFALATDSTHINKGCKNVAFTRTRRAHHRMLSCLLLACLSVLFLLPFNQPRILPLSRPASFLSVLHSSWFDHGIVPLSHIVTPQCVTQHSTHETARTRALELDRMQAHTRTRMRSAHERTYFLWWFATLPFTRRQAAVVRRHPRARATWRVRTQCIPALLPRHGALREGSPQPVARPGQRHAPRTATDEL